MVWTCVFIYIFLCFGGWAGGEEVWGMGLEQGDRVILVA